MKHFASEYPRNEEGWIVFPPDATYRRQVFKYWDRLGISLSSHPAKANTYMVQSCIEYVSEPEETVMDIMTGTGTIMVAALIGRRVICIELEKPYQDLILEGIKDIESIAPGAGDMITLVPGDCTQVLPLPVDHVIFSPPYANIMKKKDVSTDQFTLDTLGEGILNYSLSPNNIGNLNEFLYHQRMEIIYKKVLQSIRPGGTLTILIKDHMEQGKRVFLGERAKRDCIALGYELDSHHRYAAQGTAYLGIRRARGEEVVDNEEIIILRRPM